MKLFDTGKGICEIRVNAGLAQLNKVSKDMNNEHLYQRIARLIAQNKNCNATNNLEWAEKSFQELKRIAKEELPSGSGIDCGTKIDLDASTSNKIVLLCSYHHMNESGMYDGWTAHKVIVTPDLMFGYNLKITGSNRNGIKEYLADVFTHNLMQIVGVAETTNA